MRLRRTLPSRSLPCLLVLVATLPACRPGPDPEPAKPLSIVLVSIDALRRDHVGFHGYERDTTPFLDELAQQSLVFERAYTTMSWTLIAHMSLLTGLYPAQHDVVKRDAVLPRAAPTLAQRLQEHGYYTMGFYFPGWLDGRYGFDRGFDVYASHKNAEEADRNLREAMAARPKDRPFFLFVHLFDVHNAPLGYEGATMYSPPAPFDELYVEGAKELVRPLNIPYLWNRTIGDVTPKQHDAIVALYDGGINYVDERLREWYEGWRDEGLLDEILFVFTSDHGEGLAQRGDRYGGHGARFDEGLRVPFFLRFPDGRYGGERVDAPVSHVDLVPTLLDALRLDADARLPGHSLLRPRPEASLIYAQGRKEEVLIQWPWKVHQRRDGDTGNAFHLIDDPGEEHDVRATGKMKGFMKVAGPIRKAAAAEREDWFWPSDALQSAPMDAETEAALNDLGYTGDDP